MAKSVLSTMGKAAVQCLKNPGRPSFWVEAEGRYICPDENEVGRIEHTTALSAGRLDPRFKLVFLTAASGTLLFTLICVAINLTTNGDLPPARKELTESILTMAKIGFGAIDLWACVVAAPAQSENLLPEPELPLIHLDSPYNQVGQFPRPASPPQFPLRSRTASAT
jgi:hypothetical protein